MAAVNVHEAAYANAIERERPLLRATAFLLSGDPVRAERLVQLVLAQLYERWPHVQRPQIEALRSLIRADRHDAHLPWESARRVELVDGALVPPASAPIIADLRRLSYDQRAVIILERYAELPTVQIAAVVERPIDSVLSACRAAQAALVEGNPGRSPDGAVAAELAQAVPAELSRAGNSADDLDRGRRLRRRHQLRRALIGLAAIVLAVVTTSQAVPDRRVPAAEVPLPQPSASPTRCDPNSLVCQGQVLIAWRSDMAEVAESHIDPTGRYFSAVGYAYDTRSDTPTIWTAQGGALAFQLFRPDGGATEVYVQIATSQQYAVRCGATTGHVCLSQRFMDGNRFHLTSTSVRQGVEVQYSPNGDQVITAIARNTTKGQVLELSTSDLIDLVQDPRLRLPER
jgi:DNA-directed RNA polymerase specialized sigma24 family protein